jgi:hypothetical protein
MTPVTLALIKTLNYFNFLDLTYRLILDNSGSICITGKHKNGVDNLVVSFLVNGVISLQVVKNGTIVQQHQGTDPKTYVVFFREIIES